MVHPTLETQFFLGIDRTFNLGACFATTLVYQHNNLKRKGTNNLPIMLAAIYLHWDGSYATYHRFFSHLQSKLGTDIGGTQSQIVIKEVALCTRHLQENVQQYLSSKAGANEKIKKKIINDIFGKDSLTACSDVKGFELKYLELLDKYATWLPLFKNYFEKIAEKIWTGIMQPRLNNRWVRFDWKNNLCQSMNHVIKLSANWKTMKLPDLVDRQYKIVMLQQVDCRRSLYGQGNYELAPWMVKLQVQYVQWTQKTKEEKENCTNCFKKVYPQRKTWCLQQMVILQFRKQSK